MIIFPDEVSGYRKLLSTVIWLAVQDACAQPTKLSSHNKQVPVEHASSAIRFIFDEEERPFFRKYMDCLDIDTDAFRRRIVALMYGEGKLSHLPLINLPHNAKKSFRFNHTHWLTYNKH